MGGFEDASTSTLENTRERLLRGLDEVAAHIGAGTFEDFGDRRTPPSQAGWLTLWLLEGVEAEVERRAKEAAA
jgi:hypothetical protein